MCRTLTEKKWRTFGWVVFTVYMLGYIVFLIFFTYLTTIVPTPNSHTHLFERNDDLNSTMATGTVGSEERDPITSEQRVIQYIVLVSAGFGFLVRMYNFIRVRCNFCVQYEDCFLLFHVFIIDWTRLY